MGYVWIILLDDTTSLKLLSKKNTQDESIKEYKSVKGVNPEIGYEPPDLILIIGCDIYPVHL